MVELEENVMINASFFPMLSWLKWSSNLEPNQVILKGEEVVAFIRMKIRKKWISIPMRLLSIVRTLTVMNTWDIFSKNDAAIREDFEFLTADRKSNQFRKVSMCWTRKYIYRRGS
jgi:hypothetical protein